MIVFVLVNMLVFLIFAKWLGLTEVEWELLFNFFLVSSLTQIREYVI